MNTWETAVETVTRCLGAGVREFVVCAGARNAALLEAISRAETAGRARIWRHFEERAAGFFALGRTMETGKPCAVVTTSGTAAAELLPPVIEAFYQARPLVAITADRPAACRGSGAPQTIEQPGIFGRYAEDEGFEAWDGRRPLHLNVELGEEIHPGDDDFTDAAPAGFQPMDERPDVAALARWLREDIFRGVVVMVGGLEPDEREEVFHFCRDYGAPVVAEATSGLREALAPISIHHADRVLKAHPPGKILRIGELPSGRFWRDLEEMEKTDVWSICRNGLPGIARESHVTRGHAGRVLRALGDIDPADDALDHLQGNSARAAHIEELLEAHPDSEPALVRQLSHYAALGSSVFLGNSLPIREWNHFAQWQRPVPLVRANRGANGIDGQISTWLGATAFHADAWAILGDLTALYDLAAGFALPQVETRGRVLAVLHNNGGRIFSRLPRLRSLSAQAVECMTNPHSADLAGFAQLWGMTHHLVRTADDLDTFEPGETTTLLEIRPSERETEAFWKGYERI